MRAAVENRQTEAAECGLACLAMASQMAGSTIDLAWLRRTYPPSARGATLQDLGNVASAIGMSSRAVRCDLDELKDLKRPAILHWGLSHYVVLDRVEARRIRIFDPARGHVTVPLATASEKFSGIALELTPTPAFKRRGERSPLKLGSLLVWNAGMSGALLQALLLSLLLQAYVLASPFYIQLAVDEAALKGDRDLLTALAIGFGLFALFNAGADILRGFALQRVSSLLNWHMAQRLFHHMIRLPLPWFQRRRLADALSRFQSLDPLRNLIANGLVGVVIDGVLSIATLAMMIVFAPDLTLVAVAAFGLYALVRTSGIPFTIRLSADALQANIAEQGKRIETLRAIQTIKVMGAEPQREGVWANKLADMIRTAQRSALANLSFTSVQRLLDTGANILIIYLGVLRIIDGHLTIGALYAFTAYRNQFHERAVAVFEQVVNWRMLDVYTFRLADVVLSPIEEGLGRGAAVADPIRGKVELDAIWFRYGPTDPIIIRGASLSVEPGEFVAIVGPSGTGKSTLLKVLCGLYPATSGEVKLDGLPLSVWGTQAVRSALGVVLQDDDLLPGTILENVTFFSEDVDMEHVWECLRLAAIEPEVRALPMQADTFVGDMGTALSGGQKQRLLLARALYKRPSILVLDEATSHLDLARERAITSSLKDLSITRIVVAHRPETIASADRVFLLKDGLQEIEKPHLAEGAPAALKTRGP